MKPSVKVYEDVVQGSVEWLELRSGKPTASRFKNIITAKTGELAKARYTYLDYLIAERYVPKDVHKFQGNTATERGTDLEPEARELFQRLTGLDVVEVGFCLDTKLMMGCSPDGLIVDASGDYVAGVEIKSPYPVTHVGYVREQELPDTYKQQVHGSMAVTGLDTWHFFSYYPGLKPLHLIVEWDEYTDQVLEALRAFQVQYQAAVKVMDDFLQVPEHEREKYFVRAAMGSLPADGQASHDAEGPLEEAPSGAEISELLRRVTGARDGRSAAESVPAVSDSDATVLEQEKEAGAAASAAPAAAGR